MKLSEALNRLNAADYRNLLRQAVSERRDYPNNFEVERIKATAGSIVFAGRTAPSLRDRLTVSVLLAIAAEHVTWRAVLNAIEFPADYCRESGGGGNYVFGWPRGFEYATAEALMQRCKDGAYDAVASQYKTFNPTPAMLATTPTEKPMITELNIDEVYETMLTLAATRLSLLRTQAEADAGGELDPPTVTRLIGEAKAFAIKLGVKHFGGEKAEAAAALLAAEQNIGAFKGTESDAAAEAVRKIVTADAATFRLDAGEVSAPAEPLIFNVNPKMKPILDMALANATDGTFANIDALIEKVDRVTANATKKDAEIDRLKRMLAAKPIIALKAPVVTSGHGAVLPAGTVISVKAGDVFRSPDGRVSRNLDFEVPAFDWGGAEHPYVPTIDKNFIFKPMLLARFLWSVVNNKKSWLHGHTGTGKTSFAEQVFARLNWPFFRVNLDSEITRMDMIGRDVLSGDGKGATISKFVDGILPQAMSSQGHGGVLCVDEISFGRPDVMYVFQRVLEDKGLLMNEDGGRLVKPGDMFRIVATDNTRGQGDEFGAYPGARPQSSAFLDRFTCWIEFDYLAPKDEKKLLLAVVPGMTEADAEQVASFAAEVRTSFKSNHIYQTITPRGTVSLAQAYQFFINIVAGDRKTAINMAAETTILSKASETDKAIIKGLYDRTFK